MKQSKDMLEVLHGRRSIRRYQSAPVSRADIETILRAGSAAPSSKNRQPWRFIVAEGNAKEEALAAMGRGLTRERKTPLLPNSVRYLAGAEATLNIMRQAPVLIFVADPIGMDLHTVLTAEERIYERCNAQSIGAAVENMTLAATALGLGSLWICDTCFAQAELQDWLGEAGELVAALAVGYADEAPPARPRRPLEETVIWRA